jgi:hypothetical protein
MRTFCAFLLLWNFQLAAKAADTCEPLVPQTLKAQLLEAFAGFRLPRETDNLPEDVQYAEEHAQRRCLGVATADFDGDGVDDYVVGLTALHGDGALVVVALTRPTLWVLQKLDAWPDQRIRLYVSAEPSGNYDRVGDEPLEPGEVEHLRCPHAVAIYGATESTGVAYCFAESRWTHARFSD